MNLSATIEKATNGYILRILGGIDEPTDIRVFSEDNYEDERLAFSAMIYVLAEEMGIMHDKFKNDNLRISFDGIGRKFVESDKK